MENETFNAVAGIRYITPENSTFFKTPGGLLGMKSTVSGEEKTYPRVVLHRAFPFNDPENYISVLEPIIDKDSEEVGIIRELGPFDADTRALFEEELARKYFCPKIRQIKEIKDRYGYSYWDVVTDSGAISFAMRDTHRNIVRISETRLMMVDVDGNRYEIPDLDAIDVKSVKRLDMYT